MLIKVSPTTSYMEGKKVTYIEIKINVRLVLESKLVKVAYDFGILSCMRVAVHSYGH